MVENPWVLIIGKEHGIIDTQANKMGYSHIATPMTLVQKVRVPLPKPYGYFLIKSMVLS